jgi:hypothetical protein
MRAVIGAAVLGTMCSTTAYAQSPGLWYAGTAAGVVRVAAEEVNPGGTSSIGAVFGVRLTPAFSIEVEAARGLGDLDRDFAGRFISFAGPSASFEERERLSVTVQRITRWRPGFSGTVVAMWRPHVTGRVGGALFAGVTGTRYDESDRHVVLDIPVEVNRTEADIHRMLPDTSRSIVRGGLTIGLLIPVRLTRNVTVAPDVRYLWGSIGDEIYTTVRAGARLLWGF